MRHSKSHQTRVATVSRSKMELENGTLQLCTILYVFLCALLSITRSLSAAFPARRAMKRASRQILTAFSPPINLTLSSTVYWRTAHGVRSARILSAVAMCVVLFRPWETRRATLLGPRELCGR